MFWQIFQIFAVAQAEKLFFIYLGTLTKRKKIFNGQLVHLLATLSLDLILIFQNIDDLWNLEVKDMTKSLLILSGLFSYKFLLGFLTGILTINFFSVEFPLYFKYTFLALLISDSVLFSQNEILKKICPLIDKGKDYGEKRFELNIKCDERFDDLSSLLQIFNLFVCFLPARIMIYRDYYVKREIGETLLWVGDECFDCQLGDSIKEKTNNLFNRDFYCMLFRKSIEYCVSRQMLSIVITILFKIFAPVLNFNELHIAKIFKYFTKEVSSLLDPLINIILGYQIANLDNNLKKGMMINSKLAFLRSFLRLVIIPLVFIFSILLFKSQIFSLDSQIEDVSARFFISMVSSSSTIPLIFCLSLGFAYKEISFFLYYEIFLGIFFAPIMIYWFIF